MQAEDDLDPALGLRPLSLAERTARQHGRETDAALEAVLRPRIAGHVLACRQTLDVIEDELDRLVDTFDLDPSSRTRAAALWLLMGRCVGQQRAVLLLAEHGMAVEGRPLDRSIKEMSNTIKGIAAAGPAAEKLARQWLADDNAYVKPQAGRRAMADAFGAGRANQAAAFAHLGVASLEEADKRAYGYLSEASHGRRSSMLESYYSETRHMARGTRYALLEQARAVDWASSTTAASSSQRPRCCSRFAGRPTSRPRSSASAKPSTQYAPISLLTPTRLPSNSGSSGTHSGRRPDERQQRLRAS